MEGIMGSKILVCGGNGAGKSTLGRYLAGQLGYRFADIEDYYFPKPAIDYPYRHARTREEVGALLLSDLRAHGGLVVAAVKGDYGLEAEALFTCAVLLHVPKELRMRRVRERSFDRFGSRMLPGGDLYEKEEGFFRMVESRSAQDVEDWLREARIPTIEVDGTAAVDANAKIIVRQLAYIEQA